MRACLATGARMVIGTTGWYSRLPDMQSLAERKRRQPALRHQLLHRRPAHAELATQLGSSLKHAGYKLLDRRDPPRDQARRPQRHRAHPARGRRSRRRSARRPHHLAARGRRRRRTRPHRPKRRRPHHPHPQLLLPPRLRRGRRPRRRVAPRPPRHLQLQRHLPAALSTSRCRRPTAFQCRPHLSASWLSFPKGICVSLRRQLQNASPPPLATPKPTLRT